MTWTAIIWRAHASNKGDRTESIGANWTVAYAAEMFRPKQNEIVTASSDAQPKVSFRPPRNRFQKSNIHFYSVYFIFQNIIKYQCNCNSIDSMIIICGIQAALSLRHARLYFNTIKIGAISKQSVPWRSQSHPWPPPRSTCPSRRSPRPCSRPRAASRWRSTGTRGSRRTASSATSSLFTAKILGWPVHKFIIVHACEFVCAIRTESIYNYNSN